MQVRPSRHILIGRTREGYSFVNVAFFKQDVCRNRYGAPVVRGSNGRNAKDILAIMMLKDCVKQIIKDVRESVKQE